jgi:hypothetical protein
METQLHKPFQCTNCGKWKVNINNVQYVTNSRVVGEDFEGEGLWVTYDEDGTPLFSPDKHPNSQERWKVIHTTPLEPQGDMYSQHHSRQWGD